MLKAPRQDAEQDSVGTVNRGRMRFLQRAFLIANVLALAYFSLRVPWRAQAVPDGPSFHLGYSWLWKPPDEIAVPDALLTILQLLAAAVISGSIFLAIIYWHRE